MKSITGNFRRVPPSFNSEKTNIPLGWTVISHRLMPNKSDRRIAHGKWFQLKSSQGATYRVLRFSANLKGTPDTDADVVLDWPAWLELNGFSDNLPESLEIKISKARWWQLPYLAAAHPDPATRLSGILGIVSAILGIMSLFLAFMPF